MSNIISMEKEMEQDEHAALTHSIVLIKQIEQIADN